MDCQFCKSNGMEPGKMVPHEEPVDGMVACSCSNCGASAMLPAEKPKEEAKPKSGKAS